MSKQVCQVFIVIVLLLATAQAQESIPLQPGKLLERELAGGQTHTYQFALQSGQFLRVVVEQKGIDVTVACVAPDGKQIAEANLTVWPLALESLSHEASVGGDYHLVVRPRYATTPRGAYRVQLEVRATATAQDRQRLAAERLLGEAVSTYRQAATGETMLEKAQQSLALWHELGDRYWEAITYTLMGNIFSARLNRAEKAIECYEQALAGFRERKDRMGEANALYGLGSAHSALSQYEKAIEFGEQALQIFREIKDPVGEANTLQSLGFTSRFQARLEKAREYLEQALAIRRAIKDQAGEAATLTNLGSLYHSSSPDKALEYYEQSLALARASNHRLREAQALSNIGNIHQRQARHEKALAAFRQALTICRELKDRRMEARLLMLHGEVYANQSQYEQAREYFEQMLSLAREIKDEERETGGLWALGATYAELGHYEKAREYLEQALVNNRKSKRKRDEGIVLFSLADVYEAIRDYERARASAEQAQTIFRDFKDKLYEAGTTAQLGRILYSLGQYEQARVNCERGLAIFREQKVTGHEAIALNDLGRVYEKLGRTDQARNAYAQALTISREVKARNTQGEALRNLMGHWSASGNPNLAIFFGKQSVNTFQETRSDLQRFEKETQQQFLKSKEDTYRTLADLLISQGRLPEAEQIIRMLKEEEYFEYIRRDDKNAPKAEKAALTPEEAALDKRYREVADKLTELGAERGALLEKSSRTPAEEQRLAKLEADLMVAGQAFQRFLDNLATEFAKQKEASAQMTQLLNAQGLMEDLRELGKGVVALYTLVGEEKYRVILTTADFQRGYEYPIKAAELNRKVLAFREVLQNPKLDPLPLAQELYKILVGPVAKDLQGAKAQMLMWSLDGVLRYVPIAALHDGEKYLLERYRNAVFTPVSNARFKDAPSRNWRALGLGVTKSFGATIPALPGVAEEMRGIIRDESTGATNGVLPGTIRLDEQFTQETMLAGLRARNPVVHVASHFQFQPGNETNSALLLGDGKFLSLAQIKTLPNIFGGVELLTLSACNTATSGSGANGKEVEGFGVLAQRQGAKAVVASLWPVADRSTKELMQEFYKLREAHAGTTKAEALRQAQLKLLRGELIVTLDLTKRQLVHEADKPTNQSLFKPDPKKPYAHPYYWAPFILIGNWR